jgi:hypothetical protein
MPSLITMRSTSLVAVSSPFATEPYTNAARIPPATGARASRSTSAIPEVFRISPRSSGKIGEARLAW